jgi:multiple sugar transport system permease protein
LKIEYIDKTKSYSKVFGLSLARWFIIIALGIVIIYPIFYSISIALRPAEELYDPLVVLIPKVFTLENIKNAFEFLNYPSAIANSFLLVIVSTLLQVLSCSLVGYGLARFNFRFKNIIFALVILVIVVPPQTVIIPNYMQFRYFDPLGICSLINLITGSDISINLIDTNFAFYLPAAFAMGIRSGLFIFMFRQFFAGMPKELEEAALVDGAGPFKTFFKVMVPNAMNSYITTFLFSIVWYWNDYVYTSAYMPSAKTVMSGLYYLKDNADHIMQYDLDASPTESILLLQSGVFLSILPLLIIYIVLQRYFTSSIERSGIVG